MDKQKKEFNIDKWVEQYAAAKFRTTHPDYHVVLNSLRYVAKRVQKELSK